MLIGLTGASGSHKTAAAKRLAKAHGFVRIHAGQPVKDAVRLGLGLGRFDTEKKGKDKPNMRLRGKKPRHVLETVSAALHATVPQFTADVLARKLRKHVAAGRHVVIEGVRQQAEADQIRRMGGKLWRLDNGEGHDPALPTDRMQAQLLADAVIDSSGDKADLKRNVDEELMRCYGAM